MKSRAITRSATEKIYSKNGGARDGTAEFICR